jgi:hypothetical protein
MSEHRLEAYRAFVAAEARKRAERDDGYLFDEPRCRFRPEPNDELVPAPGLRLLRASDGLVLEVPGAGRLAVAGIAEPKLRAALAALPCRFSRLLLELGPDTESFLEQTFSRVVFAPGAVAALETDLPSLEIVRFPGSPYEVVRSY